MDYPNHKQNVCEETSADDYISTPSIEFREEQLKLKREELRQAQLRYDLIIDKIINGIYFIVVTLEVLLGFRFLLQLAQANPENLFARITFGLTEPFAAPFANLFPGNGTSLFDGGLLVALVVYWLLGMMAIWLVGLLRR